MLLQIWGWVVSNERKIDEEQPPFVDFLVFHPYICTLYTITFGVVFF